MLRSLRHTLLAIVWQVANGLAHKFCEILLVRSEGHKRMDALELGIVRRDLLVEVQLRVRAPVFSGFLDNCARSIVARCLYGECHQAAAKSPLRLT
jgi:hypothetical protein